MSVLNIPCGWVAVLFLRSTWSRGKFQIVTGLPCKPRQFERPPTTLNEQRVSLGVKKRLRTTEGRTQRTCLEPNPPKRNEGDLAPDTDAGGIKPP